MSVTVPRDVTLPSPASTWPRGPLGRVAPNWNCARRTIGVPAITASETTSAMKRSGASTGTRPARTSASSTTPRTAAVVVGVAVGVDDRDDRPPPAMREVELEPGARGLGGDEGSTTMTPRSPSSSVMLEMSNPRIW
jgi:hypothetical protein